MSWTSRIKLKFYSYHTSCVILGLVVNIHTYNTVSNGPGVGAFDLCSSVFICGCI